MNSQYKIRALNIVYVHWIIPSQKIKLNALKKLQRFCRRGSGAHAHISMVCNEVSFDKLWSFEPPVLYRQVCNCMDGDCESIPIRIYNKHKRMHYAIKKIYGDKDKEIFHFTFPQDGNLDIINNKFYTSQEYCYCNNKPFNVYKKMVTNPRGNFNSKHGIRYIMCELSGDELTYYTRFKLSRFLEHRLN